jgi:phenylalanyl-tRNA synthetase beta chain
MKLSLDWIKDYVEYPEGLDLSRLAYDLTMSVVEVEGARDLSEDFKGIVSGRIAEIRPHPDADRLRICLTETGAGETREIVCGGSNLSPGMKVALALPGASVRWHGEGEPVLIKESKVRGVASYGMICAAGEIGLSELFPGSGEREILDLSEFDYPSGTPLAMVLGLSDIILEIDNKSITNRPDLWGHYGVAREIATLYDLPLKEFVPYVPGVFPDFRIDVLDGLRCPRYIGVRIEGLRVIPSPFWIRSRIWRVGMRPINAMVDITNYVMLSVGQPTHAFDSDNIEGHITVRRAKDREKLLLLNEKELSLSGEDLVIADEESPVGLAGVMGGGKDSVLPETTRLILEIANFEALCIRRTAANYETRTEAAIRYEKAIDPERCAMALSLSMELFGKIYPEMSVTGFIDIYPNPLKRTEIDLSLSWLRKRLGKDISTEFMENKLIRLGFEVRIEGDAAHIVSPTWRSTGDVSIPDDIMEEVARIYGFENFEPAPITTSFEGAINQIEVDLDRRIREYLAFRCGMREVFTYPWIKDEYAKAIFPNFDNMLSLATPPSPDERLLRSSLIPNLSRVVSENLRFFHEFSVFETAEVMYDSGYSPRFDPSELLPLERKKCAGAFAGDSQKIEELFRRAKGVLEAMPKAVHIHPFKFKRETRPFWADQTVWLNIYHEGERVGDAALLSKKASLDCGFKIGSAILFELDLDSLKALPSRTNVFRPLPEYPTADYDVSMLFDSFAKWEDIAAAIGGGEKDDTLRGVSFIEEYRGKQVPEGKKSLTFRLVIGSLSKTLTSEEIDAKANAVIKRLSKAFGAELRS